MTIKAIMAERRARAIIRAARLNPDAHAEYLARSAKAIERHAGALPLSVERVIATLVLCELAPGVSTTEEAETWLNDFVLVTGAR